MPDAPPLISLQQVHKTFDSGLQALAERLLARGIDFIEAPLSGSSQQIERDEATLLLGGQPEALLRHADLLQTLATQRFTMGGAGMGGMRAMGPMGAASAPMDMAARQQMMEKRMEMMQSMMQMMMDRMGAPPAKP